MNEKEKKGKERANEGNGERKKNEVIRSGVRIGFNWI
jgi:hypothetical protein